jgi:hypothetical protein
MSVTLVNPNDVPDDLAPGTYCCRLDESSSLIGDAGFRARFIVPPRSHEAGDCLIQLTKESSDDD